MPVLASPFAQLDLVRHPEQRETRCRPSMRRTNTCSRTCTNKVSARTAGCWCSMTTAGALAASLAPHVKLTSSGDSHLGFIALQRNLERNGLTGALLSFVPSSEIPQGPFDHVLVRVPKTWHCWRNN